MRALRERLATMSARCQSQLRLALDAFWRGQNDKVADVEALDRVIDRDEKEVDALLLRILALRHPVASDLRMLTASFKVVTDLERIGDEALDIARATASRTQAEDPTEQRLRQMTDAVEAMLATAVNSFLNADEKAATEVRRAVDAVESLYEDVLRETAALTSQQPTKGALAMRNITVAKCLERIADHAANMAQGTLFVIGNEDMPR